jgi:hypothetical protein
MTDVFNPAPSDSPNEPLAAKLDNISVDFGYAIGDLKDAPEAKAAILAAFADELRAIRPKKINNWKDVDPKLLGNKLASYNNLSGYQKAHNKVVDTITRNARERGHQI